MTNKKLKLAAMSVALTACVAAQPMAAHAVEGPDSVEDNAAPQAEPAPVEGKTAEGEVEGEAEKQEEFVPPVNKEAKEEEQAPAFGPGTKTDDIIIDYKPAEKPDETGKSGEDGETDGSDGSGETDETENPDGTYVKGDVIDNSKKDEATGKDGKIGKATKEETPDSSSSTTVVDPDAEVKKGDPVVGKDEDGNTTITTPTETTGTETTTTTGTGKADSSTTITDTKKGEEINLDDELGKDVRPDWKTDKDAKLGGYTVDKVEPAKDGNSKTLTLKKTSPTEEKEMAAEDIAKLLDVPEGGVEKKTDDEGKTTYILKKEETSTDENGNTVTRVTYYKITGNTVETTTETTLVLKVEKGTDKGTETLDTPIQQPDINDEEAKNVLLPSGKLESILEDSIKKDDNTYTYTETIPNEDGITIREYTITKTDEARDLTYQELAERLGEGFTADQDGVYYKGEKLTFEQMEAKRHALRYQVQIKETHKTFDQVSGKTEAETAAKTEAIKGALRNAAKKYDITLTEDDLKDIKLTGGDLTVTREGKTYTFHYTEAGVEYSTPTSTGETTVDGKDAEDVRETTVTGTAYVTKGTISWSKPGESGTYTVSGTLKPGDNHIASKPAKPTGDNVTFTQEGDAAVYIVTTENEDGSITETIYTFREAVVSLSSPEAKQAAWEALAKAENKTVQQLKDEGYTISDIKFDSIAKSTWTVETRTRTTKTTDESLNQKILKAEGDPTWTLEGTTLKIKGGDTYKDLKKNADGTYTATKEEEGGKKVTYTFTLGEVKDLDDDTIKAMLAKEFNVSVDAITLKDGKATYEDGKTTVTIDYSNLSKKTLKIDKSVSEAVSVTETIKDGDKAALEAAQEKLYQELKKKVESIHLNEGEELWIGDLQIKDIENQKEQIIEKFTTAVSHENMSQQALIAALNAQADEAKNQTVVVNKGTKYEEKLDNYYSGDKNLQHKPKDPPKYGTPGEGDDITHLDLASGAKMDKLPDKDGKVTQTDCVLLAKGQKLEWNYDADKLVKGDSSNTTVGLQDYISKDTEDGKGYHYEYNRSGDNNNPNKSAFYKLTGTVAYDALKNGDDIIEYTSKKDAVDAYLKAVGRTDESYWTLTQKQRNEILGTYVVPLYSSSPFPTYQVYKKTAEMTSYGYMTRDANTCVNATFSRQYEDSWFTSEWDYAGGYDLMISDLVQVSEGQVVGQTQSSIKSLWAPLAIRSTQSLENKSLQLNTKQTSTPVTTDPVNLGSGYEEEGSFTYDVSYKHTDTYPDNCNKGVQGTGTGKYKTFTQLLKEKFSGKGETTYDKGSVSYTHRTTDKVNTTPVSKETVTTTDAHVGYNYTSIETRTVTVNGEETVIVPPVTPPETPVEDETPDEVVTPETPELPPVQDATPDDAAPETPVLPSDAVLPAVQDALPQTGVNWMAALGMAFSGMLLTIAGAFASLKYKEKH
jgi:hypothetical protein